MNERVNGYKFSGGDRNKAIVTRTALKNCFVCAHTGSISTYEFKEGLSKREILGLAPERHEGTRSYEQGRALHLGNSWHKQMGRRPWV